MPKRRLSLSRHTLSPSLLRTGYLPAAPAAVMPAAAAVAAVLAGTAAGAAATGTTTGAAATLAVIPNEYCPTCNDHGAPYEDLSSTEPPYVEPIAFLR